MEKIGEMKIGNEKVKDISKRTLFRLNRDIYVKYYGKDVPYKNYLAEEKKREQDKPNRLALDELQKKVTKESRDAMNKTTSKSTATARINKILKKFINDNPNISKGRIFDVFRSSVSHHTRQGFPGEYLYKNYPLLR